MIGLNFCGWLCFIKWKIEYFFFFFLFEFILQEFGFGFGFLFIFYLFTTQTTSSLMQCSSAKKARYNQEKIIPIYVMEDSYIYGYYSGLN